MRPPRAAEALLRRVLPGGVVGASIVRDLREEYRARRSGGLRADLWYWREALLLAAHYARAGLRREPASGPPPRSLGPQRRTPLVERIGLDLRYALRRLAKNPGFAAVALLTMALGIGANVAIYSVVRAVLLEPLPYRAPHELVALWEWNVPRDRRTNVANPGNVKDWRERSETLEDIAAVTLEQPVVLTGGEGPVEARGRFVGGNFFSLLGLEPELGRLPGVVAEQEGQPEIVLSHRFWTGHYGRDPGVVGRTVTINGLSAVVVGVLPAVYVVFGEGADLFVAIPLRGDQTTTGRYLHVVGRLADGVTVETASEEMRAIAAGLEEEYPEFDGGWSVNVVPLQEEVVGDVRAGLWILLGSVGLLLLIACANVANLFLARATERRREMAVRTSLGAGRGRLVGQLLVESLLVAGLGALLGVGLARLATGVLARTAPDAFALPRVSEAGIDGGVMLFAVTLTVVTGLLFGLLPAVHAARVEPARTLNAEGRGPGRGGSRVRNALVVAEVALSVVLLVGAGLLGRSFLALTSVDPGLDTRGVVTARVSLQGEKYQGTEPDVRFFDRLVEEVRSAPGVDAAGAITFLPFTGLAAATTYHPGDRPLPPRPEWPAAEVRNVAGDYFAAMGVEIVRGRALDGRDRADSPDAVVVSRSLAERWWPDRDPLGRRLLLSWVDEEELEVVGVAEDVLHDGLDAEAEDMVYLSYAQKPYFSSMVLAVRSPLPTGEVVRMLEERVGAIDPDVPLSNPRPMEDVLAASVARPRMTAFLMGVFAVLAATLAAVGLYGVLSYAVSRRVREIGVRVALGAEPGRVVGLVVGQGMLLVAAGSVVGVAASLLMGDLVQAVLFGVRASDPVALAGAVLLLLTVGAVASSLPAFRATRVDPAEALRAE